MKQTNNLDVKKIILKDLVGRGKSQGMLTCKEIMDAFEEVELSFEQIESIYETIENIGIDVIGDKEEEIDVFQMNEDEIDTSIPEEININDTVKMYLKEIEFFRLSRILRKNSVLLRSLQQ